MKLPGMQRLANVGVWISGLATLAMMVHITADVALKYLLNQGVPATLEIVSTYYMVATVFLPIAALELSKSSIAVDVVYQYLPRPLQFVCMVVVYLTSVIVYLTLAWNSWGDALRAFRVGEVMMGGVSAVSVWPSRFVMPISLLVAGAVCLWHLILLFVSKEARDTLMLLQGPEVEVKEGA